MSIFAPRVTRIKGISDKRRLPRLGKLRLGFKLKKGAVEYPAELPFFLLPQDVARIYGSKVSVDRAKELGVTRQDVLNFIGQNLYRLAEEVEIMLPLNEIEAVFPQAYKWYGQSRGTKCTGDGELAYRYDEAKKEWNERKCPCEILKTEQNPKGECTQRGHLLCLIPKVNMGGIYQVDCGSYNSIVDINSCIDYVQALVGRFAMVPLVLRRIPTLTHHDGKKQTHFTMQILLNVAIQALEGLRKDNARILMHTSALAIEHEDINPAMDKEEDIIIEAETEEIPSGQPESQPEPQKAVKQTHAAPTEEIKGQSEPQLPLEKGEPEKPKEIKETLQEKKIKKMHGRIVELKKLLPQAAYQGIREKFDTDIKKFAMQDWVLLTGELEKALADVDSSNKEDY